MYKNNLSIHVLRYILACVGVLFLVQAIDVGVSGLYITISVLLGMHVSRIFLLRGISFSTTIVIHVLVYALIKTLFLLIQNSYIKTSSPSLDLYPDVIYSQILFLYAAYCIVFFENILFWKKSFTLSIEVFSIGTLLIALLSGHRSYNIDIPNAISSLTWKIPYLQKNGIEPHELLVSISFVFAFLSIVYIYLAHGRNLVGDTSTITANRKKRTNLELICAVIGVLCMFFFSRTILHSFERQLSQVMNGVAPSQNLQNGESNLGFNKASNPSRQAAAFVRLQNSFDSNPWKPMLYLREGALSTFNGKEIVKSGNEYDTDAPVLRPGEVYRSELLDGEYSREKLLQAVYVLSDKVTPFAIDAPIQFTPIKNPNPKRFRYAYTALSMALTDPLSSLVDRNVGSTDWSKETWEHYLRAPASREPRLGELALPAPNGADPVLSPEYNEDLRYKALSQQITQGESDPVKKASKIIDYLSQNSIYVLEPGHTLGTNGDPVAPYLFAEKKRGYCVHYAHAATYLLRLAGIPARIGTGFLVDLQYAKGGDILVQMGDRHAWPEIYVEGRGWIVFDVTPAQAENKEVPIPDEGLLEELMSEIDPIEELGEQLPPLEKELDARSPIEALIASPLWQYFGYCLPGILLVFIGMKLWIRFAWKLMRAPQRKIKYAYIAALSQYEDHNIPRLFGETRSDYAERLYRTKQIDIRALTNASIAYSFSLHNNTAMVHEESTQTISLQTIHIPRVPSSHRVIEHLLYWIAMINPRSLYLIGKMLTKETSALILFAVFCTFHTSSASAQYGHEEYDNFSTEQYDTADSEKDAETLLIEAIGLLREGKSIDARSKLEYALKKDPNDHRAYLFLGQYYLSDVGHFKLAYSYLKKARSLFEKNTPTYSAEYDLGFQNQHALLLYLESEAALNLDFYDESLRLLNEYEKNYQSEWFAGQKAWVLMKLKRNNEAIQVAKKGLVEGADPKRTWNILGILLSLNNERELSLQAFQKAIAYELSMGGIPQVATHLNNSGEVYRELFKDAYAESAWLKALTLSDGCEHILPSVNLSILYTDQLRLFQAEQVLSDFQACYSQKPERKDSEHRTILALARAKIKLLSNQIQEAHTLATIAADDQQWFGKIGTNENDVKFAAWLVLAQIEHMKAQSLRDSASDSIQQSIQNLFQRIAAQSLSWWLHRKAKMYAVRELEDFEDLFIRHTDTMITYPLLGSLLEQFTYSSLKKRLDRMRAEDTREGAKRYYDFFEARKLISDGYMTQGRDIITQILPSLPEHERLLKTEMLSVLVKSYIEEAYFFSKNHAIQTHSKEIEEIFSLNPSRLRYYDIPLPVSIESDAKLIKEYKDIKNVLLSHRFIKSQEDKATYKISIIMRGSKDNVFIQMYNTRLNKKMADIEISSKKEIHEKVNEFITRVFSHTSDPKGNVLPDINLFSYK